MGLCARAGRAKFGADTVLTCIRGGSAKLVLVDEAASENTLKMFRDACAYRSVPLRETPQDALGRCTGRIGRMSAVITDEGFADRIVSLFDTENTRMNDAGVHI